MRRPLAGCTLLAALIVGLAAAQDKSAAPKGKAKANPVPGYEWRIVEGFVVSAHFETKDPVHLFGPCGQHQDGNNAVATDPPANLQSVQPRQHPVQDDEVRRLLASDENRAGTIERLEHAVALILELPPQEVIQAGFVLSDQDECHARIIAPSGDLPQEVHRFVAASARDGDTRMGC